MTGPDLLLAVCLGQALDELVDAARLGQLPFGQLAAQLGPWSGPVALTGLVMSLPGLLALGEAGLACPLFVGLLGLVAGGPLGRLGLSRTMSPTDSALSHEVTGRPHPLDGEAAVDAYRPLHEIEVPFNGRDQVDRPQAAQEARPALRRRHHRTDRVDAPRPPPVRDHSLPPEISGGQQSQPGQVGKRKRASGWRPLRTAEILGTGA